MINLDKIKSHLTSERSLYLSTILGASLFCFILGFFYPHGQDIPIYPIQFTEEINPYVPYIKILGKKEKVLSLETGQLGIRIENGSEILSAPAQTAFSITIANDLVTDIGNNLSTPCSYVASSTGKYLYEGDSAKGKNLGKGKKCFTSLEEGQKAGLTLYETKSK